LQWQQEQQTSISKSIWRLTLQSKPKSGLAAGAGDMSLPWDELEFENWTGLS
jgi:hypothetical protein